MAVRALVERSISDLQDGFDVVAGLPEGLFTRPEPEVASSTIGQHLRHVVDHYQCLLDGAEAGFVDYADRARDKRLETDRRYALSKLNEIISRLGEFRNCGPVGVHHESGEAGAGPAGSSFERELQFLLSHTIHHYSLIAVILRLNGLCVAPEFGVAQSTLRHRRANEYPLPVEGEQPVEKCSGGTIRR